MLVELSISNIAIIDSLRLQFGSGFNVLTGETGTGKSIIIDAVSLLLGGRASTEIIRTGCETAGVEGIFSLAPEVQAALEPALQELGLESVSDELILSREISRERRNICRVNGRAVTLNTLQELSRHLIDIHGQGDHLSLLQVRRHVDFLDRFGNLWEQRKAFAAVAHELRQVRGALKALRQDERELARRIDLLTYQVDEIKAAALRPNEEVELERERNLLVNAEKLMRLSSAAYTLLTGGEEEQRAVTDLLGNVVDHLMALAKVDDTLNELSQAAESALYQLEELAHSVRDYRDGIEYDPRRLQAIEERMALIFSLKRKYGDSIEEILEFGRRAREELDKISHSEERIADLEKTEQALLAQMAELGSTLSEARKQAAQDLSGRIEEELADLNMEHARFFIDLHWEKDPEGVPFEGERYAFDSTGLDRVEFLIAPNPGEDFKPLAKIASGGETSRLMLAMKTALSSADPVPTLIFDEIDTGIGGRTGSIVGRKLWMVAKEHQVFCVTHLAQMACYSERHFHVTKHVVDGRTVSTVQVLTPEERVDELALMLGGAVTQATRRSAEELLRHVNETNDANVYRETA